MRDRILLIRTGGTIDSEEYDDPKNPPVNVQTLKGKNSLIWPTIAQLPHHEDVEEFRWKGTREKRFVKDSKKFTLNKFAPDDIAELADIIKHDKHRFFLITHGTDDMVKNAGLLAQALQGSDKVVVFAGAIVPLSMHPKYMSDGVEILRFAIEHMRDQPAGVCIAGYNAKTKELNFFDPRHTQKDRKTSLDDLKFTLGRGI